MERLYLSSPGEGEARRPPPNWEVEVVAGSTPGRQRSYIDPYGSIKFSSGEWRARRQVKNLQRLATKNDIKEWRQVRQTEARQQLVAEEISFPKVKVKDDSGKEKERDGELPQWPSLKVAELAPY